MDVTQDKKNQPMRSDLPNIDRRSINGNHKGTWKRLKTGVKLMNKSVSQMSSLCKKKHVKGDEY